MCVCPAKTVASISQFPEDHLSSFASIFLKLNLGSKFHDSRAIMVFWPKPRDYRMRPPIYLLHKTNLMTLFFNIGLVDTYRIYPEGPRLEGVSKVQ